MINQNGVIVDYINRFDSFLKKQVQKLKLYIVNCSLHKEKNPVFRY